MKRIFPVLFAIIFISSFGFAQEPQVFSNKTFSTDKTTSTKKTKVTSTNQPTLTNETVSTGNATLTNETASATETPVTPDDTKTYVGKVAKVFLGDFLDEAPVRIEVVDEKGQKLVFFMVKEKANILDKNGKPIGVGRLNIDDKVIVKYTVDVKNHKAVKSIRVSE